MKRILVTGAGGSASYNFIQSLRSNPNKEDFYIVGTDSSKYHIELAPVDMRYILPKVSDPLYLEKLNHIIEQEHIEFVHAQPDPEVAFLSKHRSSVNVKLLLPDDNTIALCQQKMELTQVLKNHNISVPEAYLINSEEDLEHALTTLLKTHEKVWLRATQGAGSRAALPVSKLNHAKMWIDYWATMKQTGYGSFMVSEFLPGKEYAFQSLWINGSLIMSQARERIEYIFGNLTPSGQSSSPSVAKTVRNDELNQLAEKAIKAIDSQATGIFCIDMKTDKNGTVKIIEINIGRFFTTSLFFSEAGLNMPYFYVQLGLGETPNITSIKPFNNLPEEWYWVRMIDMGYKLIKDNEWTSIKV